MLVVGEGLAVGGDEALDALHADAPQRLDRRWPSTRKWEPGFDALDANPQALADLDSTRREAIIVAPASEAVRESEPTAADYMVSPAITAVMLNTRSNSFDGGLGYGGSGAWLGAGRSTQSPGLDSIAYEATINAANL